jgi:integrase
VGHIQDRWFNEVPDSNDPGKTFRVPTPLNGTGLRYKVRYVDPNGKERSKSFPDKKLGLARDFLSKVEADKITGDYLDPDAGKIALRVYIADWLKGQTQDEESQRTLRSKIKNQIYPKLGDFHLSSINESVVREWLSWMRGKELSESYIASVYNILSSVMLSAKDERKIRNNPLRSRSIKPPSVDRKKMVPWTEAKAQRIRLALMPRQRVVVPIGTGLGLRQGEVLGLSPDDIDRKNMVVLVSRQVVSLGGVKFFKLPKGRKTRTVPISRGLLDELDDYMKMFPPVTVTLPWAKAAGELRSVRLLLVNDNGHVDSGNIFNRKYWAHAFRRAGLPYVEHADGMHALRHFYASHLLANGVTIKELAEYLGHTDPGFTLRTYTHLLPSSYDRARRAIDALYRPKRSQAASRRLTA